MIVYLVAKTYPELETRVNSVGPSFEPFGPVVLGEHTVMQAMLQKTPALPTKLTCPFCSAEAEVKHGTREGMPYSGWVFWKRGNQDRSPSEIPLPVDFVPWFQEWNKQWDWQGE